LIISSVTRKFRQIDTRRFYQGIELRQPVSGSHVIPSPREAVARNLLFRLAQTDGHDFGRVDNDGKAMPL
jgi:hypothetical protein